MKTITIDSDVRDVLARSSISSDRVVLPPEQLDRKLYERINKALVAAGGKWNRSAKAHLFARDPREALGLAAETGKVVHVKNTLQAFYTPCAIADRLVALIGPLEDGDCVLEPSCGDGSIVGAIIRHQPGVYMTAIDIDREAMTSARMDWGRGRETRDDFINADFLDMPVDPTYDVVLMNPPFTKDQDIEHVMHAWEFVRPGGRLATIMSMGWRTSTRGKRKRFREFVELLGGKVIEVEAGAFKESGTDVSTVMVRLDKPE